MSEKLITSDKLILGCGSFILIGFVFVGVGDSAGGTATTIGGYCFLFGIISPLIVMAFRSKINGAFYKRNPQPKIERSEDLNNRTSHRDDFFSLLVKNLKDLGFWSIIPLTLSAVTVLYAFKLIYRLDVSSFVLYWWALVITCLFFFSIFHYLFNKYINK
tara:strand:+ start:3846 stop:4325 length:480 start_codon:yes stop_codon:yes gene_type:complete